jgi:hypothetical protein
MEEYFFSFYLRATVTITQEARDLHGIFAVMLRDKGKEPQGRSTLTIVVTFIFFGWLWFLWSSVPTNATINQDVMMSFVKLLKKLLDTFPLVTLVAQW